LKREEAPEPVFGKEKTRFGQGRADNIIYIRFARAKPGEKREPTKGSNLRSPKFKRSEKVSEMIPPVYRQI